MNRRRHIWSFLAFVWVFLQIVAVAYAVPRHVKKPPVSPVRTIQKEGKLSPKKEYILDATIQKTKNLQPVVEAAKTPSLLAAELNKTDAEFFMDAKLDEEIKLSYDLLGYESKCEEVSVIRFRLADLSWEKSKRKFFKANDFNTLDTEKAQYNTEMKALQGETLNHYQKILDDCPGFVDTPKVLFYYGRALMELERAKESSVLFYRVIHEYAKTEWVPQAWFMIGEYYFNTVNDANAALKAYIEAAKTPHTPVLGFALYKQGWCYLNVAEFQLAMQRFVSVIHISNDAHEPLDERTRIALRKEALKDYVRVYARVGNENQALTNFLQLGGASQAQPMLENLGNWYISQGEHGKVITVYRELIKNYPKSTRVLVFQGRIVDAASRLGNPHETIKEAKILTEYFKQIRELLSKYPAKPAEQEIVHKDIAEAEELAENTIRRLALDYHKDAKKLRGLAQERHYQYALELYKHYLAVFPKDPEGVEVHYSFFMRFYYAEVLYQLGHLLDAAQNYDQLLESNPHPKDAREKEIVVVAAEEAVRAYDDWVTELDAHSPPQISGTTPKDIPAVKQQLIAACQRYIDYIGNEGDKIVEIRYKMARIYYTYNHFDKAAPAFDDIVRQYPQNPVACYAANLALDIYNGQKDYVSLQAVSHGYVYNEKLACSAEDKQRFAKIEEQSSFYLIKENFENKKRYIQAGNAYMQFYKNHPTSDLADDAVYNAAVAYDLGNHLDKANEIRRFLVEKMPQSPLVPETLYNIAQSFERVVDFANAAYYLDLFATRYPNDHRSKDAIYNSGVYRATLHDFSGSTAAKLQFLKLYPNDPEAYQVAYSLCENMQAHALETHFASDNEALHTWKQVHNCYFDYTKDKHHAQASPDLLCMAEFERGEIMSQHTHYQKGFEEQKRKLYQLYPTWQKSHASVPRCAQAVAQWKFADLKNDFKDYKDMRISELNPTPKGKKYFETSLKAKVKQRDKLVEAFKEVVAVGDAQWALAALYSIGELYRDSIDKLLSAPIPDKIPGYKLTDEDKQLLRQKLQEMATPIEAMAVEAFRLCVSKANQLGVYNKWSVRSLDELQKLQPQDYPLVLETTPPTHLFQHRLTVRNALVIGDDVDYKPITVNFVEDAPKHAVPQETPAPTKPKPAVLSPTTAPTAAPTKTSDIPEPVQE